MTTVILSPNIGFDLTGAHPDFNSDQPRKRHKKDGLKYIPGGPGGGGHWIKSETTRQSRDRIFNDTEHKLQKSTTRRPWRERTRDAAPATASRPRRERPPAQPSFTSAADAVAAVDGYKPREERGWEEFHPDLDLDAVIIVFSANDVDGVTENSNQSHNANTSQTPACQQTPIVRQSAEATAPATTPKRRPGRPPGRRPQSDGLLSGLGMAASPPAQRPVPLPSQNPRERLSLPKPSYRPVPSLDLFEQDKAVRQNNYVSRTLENLGYQKNEIFSRASDMAMVRFNEPVGDEEMESGITQRVEYDMDEQDLAWLDAYNVYRKDHESIKDPIVPAILEVAMTQIEREWHALEKQIPKANPKPPQTHRPRSSSSAAVNGEPQGEDEEQDSKCAICDDGDCENTNAILFCDGCDLAVHQECYGVPYIPEGQWLCKKCSQVGKAITTCIFCPNTDGAFKQTTESKWAHLLCAIWIPEVTIANAAFMDPISQVAEVPAARWKLRCYICNQNMGACIQCGSRQCFQAFHVTCARRAKLFLKMKSTHGPAVSFDASVLKAYCNKHIPADYRAEVDVDSATAEARSFYRREMRGRQWADSQTSALTIGTSQQAATNEALEDMMIEDEAQIAAATPGQRKKRMEIQKKIWRLPSGAPIVPEKVCKAVETALVKFNPLPRRKEFVAEACKYWTMKREARKGAALLKRLQLQLETFSTAEIGRRDFAALGPSGGPRLDRRIEFAKSLEKEMTSVQQLCHNMLERERLKKDDAESLQAYLNTLYFPLHPLLSQILERAKKHDEKTKFFTAGMERMQSKLGTRSYSSVTTFSADLSMVLCSGVGPEQGQDLRDLHLPIRDLALATEQKEAAKVAKRILKYVQDLLEKAFRAEADLGQKPYEQEITAFQNLEKLLDAKSSVRLPDVPENKGDTSALPPHEEEEDPSTTNRVPMDTDEVLPDRSTNGMVQQESDTTDQVPHENFKPLYIGSGTHTPTMNGVKQENAVLPPIEFQSALETSGENAENDDSSLLAPLKRGGVLWCFEKFDANGLTIQDERWAGAERALSAELSDMDDAELDNIGPDLDASKIKPPGEDEAGSKSAMKKTPTKKRKRRGY